MKARRCCMCRFSPTLPVNMKERVVREAEALLLHHYPPAPSLHENIGCA